LLLLALAIPTARAGLQEVTPLPDDPAKALALPPGFKLNVFAKLPGAGADYFRGPRFMTFGPDGNLYVSLGGDKRVVMLPDANRNGKADETVLVADGLNWPQGLAFVNGQLLVANQDEVVRLERKDGQWPATKITPLITGLPSGGHTMKTLKLGPDGFLYLNIGSSCNVCAEDNPLRASIARYTIDGKPAGYLPTVGMHATSPIWATGLRNSEGFDWQPKTQAMFATNNGSDMRSDKKGGAPVDDFPPEHFNLIQGGGQYGWPYCWGNRFPDPNFPGPAGFCEKMTLPAITFPAHAAPLGMTFLGKANVPEEYKNDALVALHGSWNRKQPSGYKVVRVRFKDGKPVDIVDFATGWLGDKGAWGRPVDLAVGPDGAVYLSDDRAGMIYRITYSGVQP
jgi:glucose/arabinose dehydrogenase